MLSSSFIKLVPINSGFNLIKNSKMLLFIKVFNGKT